MLICELLITCSVSASIGWSCRRRNLIVSLGLILYTLFAWLFVMQKDWISVWLTLAFEPCLKETAICSWLGVECIRCGVIDYHLCWLGEALIVEGGTSQ